MRFALLPLVLLFGCANSHGRDHDVGPGDPDSALPDAATRDSGARDSGGDSDPGLRCPDGINPWDPSDPGNACSPEGRHCENVGGECGGGMFCDCEAGRWLCAVAEPDPACFCGRVPTAGGACSVGEGEVCGECCPEVGGWEPLVCEGGRWTPGVCPDVECEVVPEVPEVCSTNTSRDIGQRCSWEGQTCGDPCCDDEIECRDGFWRHLPSEILCYACIEFACGDGHCHDGQYCKSSPGPDDGGIFQCASLTEGCNDCGCIPIPEGYECEMVDGRPHVSGGWRGI